MASTVKFPIRLKILLLLSAAVLAATLAYLALAVKLFTDDKTQLVYELNASSVKTLSAEVEADLLKFVDKVKLLTQGHRDSAWSRAVFESEPDLISYTLYRQAASNNPDDWQATATIRNADYLKLYGLETSEVDRLRERIPIPFARVVAKRSLAWNSTITGGAPVLSLAFVVDIKGEAGPFVAVVDTRLDKILKLLSGRGIALVYVVDDEGRVVAHPDAAKVLARESMGESAIVRDALESPVAFQLKRFAYRGSDWIGAFSTVGLGGLTVISQIDEREAFRASERLIQKSAIFAAIVITLALLLSGWLSRSFTDPLRRLLGATERLSRWEFGESIHVETRDEIAGLARAFNAMAADLQRQRGEIENNRTELELKVRERTAVLEQQKKQIADSQEALVQTTRLASLGELAGATAHEVLNPLNNISIRLERCRESSQAEATDDLRLLEEILGGWDRAFAAGGWEKLAEELTRGVTGGRLLVAEDLENLTAILRDQRKREESRGEDIEFLFKEVNRITRIVNNMRALSRVGGERRPVDIHAPIEDTIAMHGDVLEKRKITLVKEFSADPRSLFVVSADRNELIQVFSNLVKNAIYAVEYANRRAGVIKVLTSRQGDRVEVRITDNGVGISPENTARVFEPTFTTKSVEEGTGLGLSISRRLVRAFGGDIEIDRTVEGEGTTFLIWFPFHEAKTDAARLES